MTRRQGLRIMAWAIAAGSIWPIGARAQSAMPPSRVSLDPVSGQTVEDLVTMALRQSPAGLAARARIEVARGEAEQAQRRPNPMVSFERRDQMSGTDNQTTIGIAVPLDLYGRAGRSAVSARAVEAATADVAEWERRRATEVRVLAVRLIAALHHLHVQEEIVATNTQTAHLTAARVEAGSAPAVERDAALIETRLSEVDARRMRAEMETAAAALRSLLGLAPTSPIVLKQSLEDLVALPALALTDDQIQHAVDTRSDVRQREAAVSLEIARVDLLKREARPEVSVGASYMRMMAGFPQLGVSPSGGLTPIAGTFHNFAFGATVSLPWSNRNQGSIAAATAASAAAGFERDHQRITAVNDIDALRRREGEARAALEAFGEGFRDLASKNLEVMRESYQMGRATLLDLLAETRRYLAVENAIASAMLELIEARVALAGALGEIR
jgi:cobalt-zinc-cadmium efflux system outer membrane protein